MSRWFTAATLALIVFGVLVATGQAPGVPLRHDLRGSPSPLARRDIPARYLTLYRGAASTCHGLPWSVLAGIGKVESDHGRAHAPGVRSGANAAGARGPMQFLPGTFRTYGVDGDHDGRRDVYDPADAVYSAAHLLCATGVAHDITGALFAYNHAHRYVTATLDWAARYAG